MELRQLRYFLLVAEFKSFSRASASAHIAQPALSRQIRKLEEELGAPLFHRNGRGVSLNDCGEEFYARVKGIFRQLQHAKAEVQSAQEVPTGEVTLGVPPQLGPEYIAVLIQRFREQYPSATIRVAEGFSNQISEWLEAGRVDVGIIYDPKSSRYLSTEAALLEELFLVGPAKAPETSTSTIPFAEVARLPLIMPDRPSSLRDRVESTAIDQGLRIRFDVDLDSIGAIKELIREGQGFSIMAYASIYKEVEQKLLTASRIVEPSIVRPLVVALPPKAVLTLPTRKLIELIHEEIAHFVARGKWYGETP